MLKSRRRASTLYALLCFPAAAGAQIAGLCNTGQTAATATGCTDVLVTPTPSGPSANRDGNWRLVFPFPITLSSVHEPCKINEFIPAWVDIPPGSWMPDSASLLSEWITPPTGDNTAAGGWYLYRTTFPVPPFLAGGGVPTKVKIAGRLASDDSTFAIYLESPAGSTKCSLVAGQQFPVNPVGGNTFQQWWPFGFTNTFEITAGADAYLYFLVQNTPSDSYNPTGLRVEFSGTSHFN